MMNLQSEGNGLIDETELGQEGLRTCDDQLVFRSKSFLQISIMNPHAHRYQGRWKREGCTDPKLPSWRKLSSESDVILSTERTELVPQILMQTVPPAAGFSIKKPKSSALDQSLLGKSNFYSMIATITIQVWGYMDIYRNNNF